MVIIINLIITQKDPSVFYYDAWQVIMRVSYKLPTQCVCVCVCVPTDNHYSTITRLFNVVWESHLAHKLLLVIIYCPFVFFKLQLGWQLPSGFRRWHVSCLWSPNLLPWPKNNDVGVTRWIHNSSRLWKVSRWRRDYLFRYLIKKNSVSRPRNSSCYL